MSDVFISYVSQDKEFVQALIDALQERGIQTVDGRLRLGDSLSNSIRQGLQQSSYTILIFSKAFFDKSWPRFEFEEVDKLDSQFSGGTKLLPVWHEIDQQAVSYFAPEFAQRLGVSTRFGLDEIVEQIAEVVQESATDGMTPPTAITESVQSKSVMPSFPGEQAAPSSQNILLTLRDNLNAHFSAGELKSLCFDLGIDYEDLAGSSKSSKVLELVGMMQRHGRLDQLIDLVRQQRPHANW